MQRTKVLLVEDNPVNSMVAELQLEKLCCDVKSVSSGEEALKILKKELFDLVLMDVEMPGMDGITATRLIRDPGSEVLDPFVRIVAMTAHNRKEDIDRCLLAGMDDHVAKPVSPDKFKSMLGNDLQGV